MKYSKSYGSAIKNPEVLKYLAVEDHIPELLNHFQENPHLLADNSGQGHHRLVTADALQDVGREGEASLLRSPISVYMHQGKIQPRVGPADQEAAFVAGYQDAARDSHELNGKTMTPEDWLKKETMDHLREVATHIFHENYPSSDYPANEPGFPYFAGQIRALGDLVFKKKPSTPSNLNVKSKLLTKGQKKGIHY